MGTAALGCGDYASSGGDGYGATPGGVKDLAFARGLVEKGQVPPPEAVVVEAMFSEHDLPVAGPACAEALCVRGAHGIAPDLEDDPGLWLQVGLSSNVDPDTFVRPDLSLVATVDVSGSMGSWQEAGSPAGIAKSLLGVITGKLTDADRFAMVTYGSSSSVALDWTAGGDAGIREAIADLSEGGSTNMEAGLEVAIDLAAERATEGESPRVLLFTDVQPNVGATESSEFQEMVADAARRGVSLTVFGVGFGMGAETFEAMSHLRGGNAFSFPKPEDVTTFVDDSWPFFAVPVAHDLSLQVSPTAGLSQVAAFGFPGKGTDAAKLDVATVFLSKRRGALLVELARADRAPLVAEDGARVALSYADTSGTQHEGSITVSHDGAPVDASGKRYVQPATRRTVALALFTTRLKAALERYESEQSAAATDLEDALDALGADATEGADADLEAEKTFWTKLLVLMRSGAAQGDLYGL